MTSPRDGVRVPSTARLLLGGALVLGLGATLVLVLSDDSRFLKLGIVAALWAALMGVFLAARFRRQVSDRADNAADMQAIYELELEREIAARREYELELEAEAKRKAEDASRQDIEALRTELGALRETLQSLLGGEVLVERLALQATRMRSLSDDAPQLARQSQVKRLGASQREQREQVVIPAEPQTELMDRVVEQRQPPRRPPTQRPQQQRPPREPERQVRPPLPREQRVDAADPGSGWWEPVIPAGQSASRQDDEPPVDMNWTPSWERGRPPRPPKGPQPSQPLPQVSQPFPQVSQPMPQPGQPMPRPNQAEPATRVQAPVTARPDAATRVQAPVAPTRVQAPVEAETRVQAPVAPTRVQAETRVQTPVKPAAEPAPRVRQPVVEPPPPPPPPVDQGGRRRADDTAGGRRRAPEPEENPGRHTDPGQDPAGGRRRRPENAPSWQETLQGKNNTGSHAKPAPPVEQSGSHAEGKSVSELLAANGVAESPRRRRRRDD